MNIIDAINNGVTNEITVDPYELHIYEERKINKSVPVDFRIINNKQPISPQDILFIHKDSIETDKILINRILSNKYHPVGSSFIFNDRTFILVDYGDIKTYNGKSYVHALVKDTSNIDEVECIDTRYRERRVIESINNMIVEDNTISSLLEYYNKYDWMRYVSDSDDGVDTKEAYDTLYEIFSVAKTFHKVLYDDIYLSDDIKSKFEDLFIDYYTVKLKLGRAEVSVPIKLFVLWLLCKYINAPIGEDDDNICPICEKVLVSYDKTKNLLDNLKIINISHKPFGLCVNRIIQNGINTIEILISTTDSVEYNYLIVLKNAVCDKQELLFDIISSDIKLFKVLDKSNEKYMKKSVIASLEQDNDTTSDNIITTDFSDETNKFIYINTASTICISSLDIINVDSDIDIKLSYKSGDDVIEITDYERTYKDNCLTIKLNIYTDNLIIKTTNANIISSSIVCYGYKDIEEISYNFTDTVDDVVNILKTIIGANSSNYPYDINELLAQQ